MIFFFLNRYQSTYHCPGRHYRRGCGRFDAKPEQAEPQGIAGWIEDQAPNKGPGGIQLAK
jgi:hypothetical protein